MDYSDLTGKKSNDFHGVIDFDDNVDIGQYMLDIINKYSSIRLLDYRQTIDSLNKTCEKNKN